MSIKFHINPESGTVSRCSAQTKCRFGGESGEENHYNSTADARKGFEQMMQKATVPVAASNSNSSEIPQLESLKPHNIQSLINIASAQNMRTLRSYRRLLEYCDLETAKNMKAAGNNHAAVALAISLAKNRAAVERREIAIEKSQDNFRSSTEPRVKQRCRQEIERLEKMLVADRARLTSDSQKVAQLAKALDKELDTHALAVSRLQSYQQEAQKGAIPPYPLARPLDQLPADSKKHMEGEYIRKSEEMLTALNSRDHHQIIKAAQMSGNDYHIENAERYRAHDLKIDRLESRMDKIRDDIHKSTKEGTVNSDATTALANEHASLLSSRNHEVRVKKGYARKLEMFRSEVKDNLAYYQRTADELNETIEHGNLTAA